MDWSLLMVLICPLMMIYMIFGMKGMHSKGAQSQSNQSPSDWSLHEDYNELKVQNEQMKKHIELLSR